MRSWGAGRSGELVRRSRSRVRWACFCSTLLRGLLARAEPNPSYELAMWDSGERGVGEMPAGAHSSASGLPPSGPSRSGQVRLRSAWLLVGPGPAPNFAVPILHSTALMLSMRTAEAILYPDPFANFDPGFVGDNLRQAYTRAPKFDPDQPAFQWDGDPWPINVIGHGLFGSELYLRARACYHSPWGALLFAAVGSTVWEYTFEATGVRPSALDLVYTPLVGIGLGELRYQGWRASSQLGDRGWRSVLMTLFDPFGEFERALGTPC